MKGKAASVSILLIIFLLGFSNVWAGDSEIYGQPSERKILTSPLTTKPETKPSEVVAMPKSDSVKLPPAPEPKDTLTLAAELMELKGLENFKQALDLCMKEVKKHPDGFKANWMTSKACRLYGMETQELEIADWKDTCKLYGKKGMAYGEKAIALEPGKPDGYYWYGMNVGIYADSVSVLTALKEGLKDKTQESFEAAYRIDKSYDKSGPIAALARFWQVLPWPLSDKDKSLEYYREFQKTKFFATDYTVQVNVFFAELLMESRSAKAEAKEMLEKVPQISGNRYWNKKAKELLTEI